MQGGRLAAFAAHTKINRADWGLDWNKAIETGGWVVADEIKIDLDLEAVEAAKVAVSRLTARARQEGIGSMDPYRTNREMSVQPTAAEPKEMIE